MTCQHPNCFQPVHSICTNHCHWSLCQEHLNEHRNSLLLEFEQVLEELMQPTDALAQSIEHSKMKCDQNQQKELDDLQQDYQKKFNKLEQKLTDIKKIENQLNKISEDLIQIKQNENILTQNHFLEMNFLLKKIDQCKKSLPNLNKPEFQNQIRKTICPLTNLNAYGLLSSNSICLCPPNKEIKYLYDHFLNSHHLTIDYTNRLIETMKQN